MMRKTIRHILGHARAARMRPFLQLVLISAAICFIIFSEGTAKSDEQSNQRSQSNGDYYFGRTTDKTHVVITIASDGESIDFDIPKSYLTFSPTWRGGRQDTLVIEFVFSTLSPLSESNKSTSDSDAVIVNLLSRKEFDIITFRKLIEGNVANLWENIGGIKNQFAVYISKLDVKRYQNAHSFVNEYFVPLDNGLRYPVYISCFRNTNAPNVGCTSHTLLATGILMDYQFRREKLDEWRKIDESVRNLLDSFVVKPRR